VSNELQVTNNIDSAIERVLLKGDLSQLTEQQRLSYYKSLCESLKLNPLTQPFEYLTLQGKTVLYAKKGATEQLRLIQGVSITQLTTQRVEDVYIVTAPAIDKTGRTDQGTGAVAIGRLQGDALANALMKAETKAKRRVTLSLCGLGMLDETELETIPGATQWSPKEREDYVKSKTAALQSDIDKQKSTVTKQLEASLADLPPVAPIIEPLAETVAAAPNISESEISVKVTKVQKLNGRTGEYRKIYWDGGAASCFDKGEFDTIDRLDAGDSITAEVKDNGRYLNIVRILDIWPAESGVPF